MSSLFAPFASSISPSSRFIASAHRLLSSFPSARHDAHTVQQCRRLSRTPRRALAVAEMSDYQLSSLRINSSRLMEDLHETCQWGPGERWGSGPTDVGMRRLALSDSDKEARDWFRKTTESLGCTVTTDEMGNQFAIRPGINEGAPTYAGSHLDTQPAGGRYDGILGVLAAVEMLKTLNDNRIETAYPVGAINWTNEEGARFPKSMVSSGVWAESIPLKDAHDLRSVIPPGDAATMRSELQRIGYLGNVPASYKSNPIAAHFELHIEQGPILEAEHRRAGVVDTVQAYRWYTINVLGRASHTGATTFPHRADALLTASKMILASHRIATRHSALASTGILTCNPGSTNTVPGHVTFSLDIRSPKDEVVEAVEAECKASFEKIAAGDDIEGVNAGCTPSSHACSVKWQTDFVSPATHFHPDCIKLVTEAGNALCGQGAVETDRSIGSWGRLMTSGAGHDSVYVSKRAPTSMIFVPCRDGVSHHPSEYSSPEACSDGANVLLGAVLRYDRLRAEKDQA